MKRNRSTMQIIAAYLEIPVASKCERMEHSEMPYRCGGKYHDLLLKQGCLEPLGPTPTYRTTKKGWLLVGIIEAMLSMLGWESQGVT